MVGTRGLHLLVDVLRREREHTELVALALDTLAALLHPHPHALGTYSLHLPYIICAPFMNNGWNGIGRGWGIR